LGRLFVRRLSGTSPGHRLTGHGATSSSLSPGAVREGPCACRDGPCRRAASETRLDGPQSEPSFRATASRDHPKDRVGPDPSAVGRRTHGPPRGTLQRWALQRARRDDVQRDPPKRTVQRAVERDRADLAEGPSRGPVQETVQRARKRGPSKGPEAEASNRQRGRCKGPSRGLFKDILNLHKNSHP